MEQVFYTLHNFLFFTKGTTYIIMGVMLVSLLAFWSFLTGRDDD